MKKTLAVLQIATFSILLLTVSCKNAGNPGEVNNAADVNELVEAKLSSKIDSVKMALTMKFNRQLDSIHALQQDRVRELEMQLAAKPQGVSGSSKSSSSSKSSGSKKSSSTSSGGSKSSTTSSGSNTTSGSSTTSGSNTNNQSRVLNRGDKKAPTNAGSGNTTTRKSGGILNRGKGN